MPPIRRKRMIKIENLVKTYGEIKNMPDTTMYQVFDMDRLYAVLDQKDTVLIQYFVFDNILKPASFFLGKRQAISPAK